MTDMKTWAALLATAGLLILILETYGIQSPRIRAVAALICALVTLRYVYWRILFTVPFHQKIAQTVWCVTFLVIELCTILSTLLIYLFMSRTISRSTEADAHQYSPLRNAPTDIFIATYNESYEILERTIIGALAVEHNDHRVWVLDDGNRPWVRQLTESLGARYVARNKGKHAKAGNVNNGLKQALKVGRPPEFVLLLDADFIPHRTILQRVLGLFDDSAVGIVQTPQHFFNADPVQANLFCTSVWPDEQRFFFNVLLPCKDAWGAAFCCGTSAVFRVEALLAAGGMATETVTEDMLTSFKCSGFGYRTIYLNERLSLGLAPESIVDFMSQRSRWCLGAIQQLFTPWWFAGRARMSVMNRLAFFDTVLFWISGAPFKIMLISAPALYWFTGTATLHASLPDLVRWMAPMLIANLIFMRYYAGNRILPIMTDVTQLLTAFVISRTVVSGLMRPFGRPFKVTAKGLSSARVVVQWRLMAPYAFLAAATILGIATHIQTFSGAHGIQGYSLNIFWSIVNAATLTLAAMACIEVPHRRRTDRFATSERAVVKFAFEDATMVRVPLPGTSLSNADNARHDIPCQLQNISLGGAEIVCPDGWDVLMNSAHLSIYNDADQVWSSLPFTVVSRRANVLTLQFDSDASARHALIRKLFTGMYHQDIEEVSAFTVLSTLARNLVS
ncbi:MAG: glycosyltransferase [Acidobacteria bacterium]|nr:glycosyltransferase [Acidobacteriota bacterium]